jgi:RNA-binding protein
MDPEARRRRELRARGHHLKPVATVTPDGLTEPVLAHLRALLAHSELIKVRVRAERRAACEQVAAALAARVPCEVLARIGRVLLLYRRGTRASPVLGGAGGR